MSLLQNSNAIPTVAGGGDFYEYQITNSIRFNGTDQALERTNGATASDADKGALSFWIKRTGASNTNSAFGSTTNTKLVSTNDFNQLEINTNNPTGYSDNFGFVYSGGNSNWGIRKFRDSSAWLHIVVIFNSDESTANDRVKIYYNGELAPNFGDTDYWDVNGTGTPSSGADFEYNKSGNEIHIARYQYNDAGWWGGQMADFIMIDGAASISDFGETKNGVWIPKDPSGLTFGNNGFWLDFKSASDPGNDASGNNNDFTNIGSIPASAIILDSPTFNSDSNGGNYCVLNPLIAGTYSLLTEGCLRHAGTSVADNGTALGTMGFRSGKWYWEVGMGNMRYSTPGPGISTGSQGNAPSATIGAPVNLVYYAGNSSNQLREHNNVLWGTYGETETGIAQFSAGDVMMCALDVDNKKMWYGRNGSWFNSGNPATGSNPQQTWTGTGFDIFPAQTDYDSTSSSVSNLNFGQNGTFNGTETAQGNSDDTGYGDFYYDPPTGFLAMCTGNLTTAEEIDPAETDDDYPQKLFSPILYTGNGSTNNITGLGFKPDLTWIKIRNTASNGPLVDSSRGTSEIVFSQTNGAEVTSANLTAFGSDGFSLAGGLASYDANFNGNTNTYVSWCWRANGGSTSAGSGDLTSTHQVDPSGGFSIVKAVGDGGSGDKTVSHGLSAAPTCILAKNLDNTYNWDTYWAQGLTSGYSIRLNTTDTQISGRWGSVTSSIFTVKENYTWVGTTNYIYYCFTNIEGYIKAGIYRGNANDDGPFIYTGFRPAFMMLREVAVDNWGIYDNKRIGQNNDDGDGNAVLYPDYHGAEENQASRAIDILSNGFKLRTSNATFNASGTYIFLAMAKNPFQYSLAR